MRGHHSFYERLFESIDVYGLPITNLVIVGTIICIILRNLIFRLTEPVAKYVADAAEGDLSKEITSKSVNAKNTRDYVVRKCQKYMYHFIWFSVLVPWTLSIAYRSPYFNASFDFSDLVKIFSEEAYGMSLTADGTVIETDYSAQPWSQEFNALLTVELAMYNANFVEDTIWDRQRADYKLMIVHHLVTIALIIICFQANIERGALYILLVMDTMDYWIYFIKLFSLLTCDVSGKPKNRFSHTMQKILTTSLAIFWWVSRVWLYGTISAAMAYAAYFNENVFTKSEHWAGQSLPPLIHAGVGFICILFALQAIWGVLILKLVYETLRAGQLKDMIAKTYPEQDPEMTKKDA